MPSSWKKVIKNASIGSLGTISKNLKKENEETKNPWKNQISQYHNSAEICKNNEKISRDPRRLAITWTSAKSTGIKKLAESKTIFNDQDRLYLVLKFVVILCGVLSYLEKLIFFPILYIPNTKNAHYKHYVRYTYWFG